MTSAARRAITVLVVAVALVALSAFVRVSDLTAQMADARDASAGLEVRLEAAQGRGADLDTVRAELADAHETLGAVIDARPGFLEAVAAFAAAEQSASGKVDVTEAHADVLAQQAVVLAERDDPEGVAEAARTVRAEAAAVVRSVEEFDAEQARIAALRASEGAGMSSGVSAPGSVSGYARVRAALDRVGGAHVPLQEYAGACGGVTADACAMRSGEIRFTAAVAGWSDGRLHWAMAHELAHIHQFAVWGAMTASPTYAALFGGDPELLANCMAQQRGFGGGVSCSGEQLAWSAGIWAGSVQG